MSIATDVILGAAETDAAQLRAEIHNALVERLEWFNARYDIANFFSFQPGSEHVYLGVKARQLCRYCGRASPEVKFKKLAYAISDQVGNDWLFDYEECDTCNAGFAKR